MPQGYVGLTLLYASPTTITGISTTFNESASFDFSSPPSSSSHSIRNIMTHEFGHWIKLEDIATLGCEEVTMWYGIPPTGDGETKKESLENPDKDGINYQYP